MRSLKTVLRENLLIKLAAIKVVSAASNSPTIYRSGMSTYLRKNGRNKISHRTTNIMQTSHREIEKGQTI